MEVLAFGKASPVDFVGENSFENSQAFREGNLLMHAHVVSDQVDKVTLGELDLLLHDKFLLETAFRVAGNVHDGVLKPVLLNFLGVWEGLDFEHRFDQGMLGQASSYGSN